MIHSASEVVVVFSCLCFVALRHRGQGGSPFASPRVEVALGLVRQKSSRRASGRIVKRLQSWQRGGGAPEQINTLGAPAVAKLTKPGDPL